MTGERYRRLLLLFGLAPVDVDALTPGQADALDRAAGLDT